MSNLVGQQLGTYRLVSLLGRGGFADVYLGEHVYLQTQWAIKVLHSRLANQKIEEFRSEARTIARLSHPNIIQVKDFGVENGIPFLVMTYAPQGTLRQRYPKGTCLPLHDVVIYIKQIASGLQYAHDQKVIHRDIKPENLLFGANNEVLLSDFGIAVVAHNESSLRTQDIAGTLVYMAPEQFHGKPRPASDQYALGIITYEWLCGTRPFGGNSLAEIANEHLSVPPPGLREKNPTLPATVESVVLRALAKDPKDRFENVQAFADALDQTGQSVGVDVVAWYEKWEKARREGDLEEAERIGPQILAHDPQFRNGLFADELRELREELRRVRTERLSQQVTEVEEAVRIRDQKQAIFLLGKVIDEEQSLGFHQEEKDRERIVTLARQLARQASNARDWEKAIKFWEKVQYWKSRDAQAEQHLTFARHNKQYTWMYENAAQLVKEGKHAAARELLKNVWRHAPEYGDPENVAPEVGLVKFPAARQRAAFTTRAYDGDPFDGFHRGLPSWVAWLDLFCLLSGIGSLVGVLTQSWLLAILSVAITTLSAYILGYRKAISLPFIVMIGLPCGATALALAWYTSTLNYDQAETSQLWLLGERTLWLGRQLDFGLILGLLAVLFLIGSIIEADPGEGCGCMIALIAFVWFFGMLIGPIWGFGFGFGWWFSLVGLVISTVSGAGVGGSLPIWWRAIREINKE